jgi:hypothetical protein
LHKRWPFRSLIDATPATFIYNILGGRNGRP